MKVVFTTSGDNLKSDLDNRFGRAPRFIVYDLESKSFEVINNDQGMNAAHGAGVRAAEIVARTGADAIVTGNCGPKAFSVLRAAGIKVFSSEASTVEEALENFISGTLKETTAPTVERYW
ncbi:MAG TPA: dinitrogenase iron-molybdenum cofactor biosynthesis protein [Kosmotogaceae bacterium]|nr:dinitrogenase iron-molybdenum cofactor biosynthesis protein [Kosmotogaceae bacterium]